MRTTPTAAGTAAALLAFAALAAPAVAQDPTPAALREQAFGAENRGDFAKAAEAFLQLVERQPHNAEWIVNAGRCLGRSGNYADAIDLLDQGQSTFPDAVEVPAMLARTYLLKGERDRGAIDPLSDYAEAAKIAEQVLAIAPDHEDSRLILAQARYLLGDWEAAVRQAEIAVRRHPQRAGAHILLGRIAMDRLRRLLELHGKGTLQGQAEADLLGEIARERVGATSAYEKAAELDPTRAHPHVMLARIAELEKRTADARRHWLAALAIDPNDGFVDHQAIQQGLTWQQRRDTYRRVRERYTARAGSSPQKAATLQFYEGIAIFEGQDWQAARTAFEGVLSRNPEYVNAHYYAALAAYELEDHDAAEAHAASYASSSAVAFAGVVKGLSAEMRGRVAAIVRFLADRAYQRGKIEHSRDLNHVIALLYNTADAWNNRAFLCRETKDFAGALDAYRRALDIEPTSPQLTNDLGVILHYHLPNEVNLAEARQLYERAIELADKVLADSSATATARELATKAKSDAQANLTELTK